MSTCRNYFRTAVDSSKHKMHLIAPSVKLIARFTVRWTTSTLQTITSPYSISCQSTAMDLHGSRFYFFKGSTIFSTHKMLLVRSKICSYRIDDSSYRLNFDLGKKNKIYHHSQKEHVKISNIGKFGREML